MAVRYLAVLRMSSMGADSLMRAARAAAIVSGVMRLLRRDRSVSGRRVGTSRRLAAPILMSSMRPLFVRARAAIATFEMACAFRVPTLRM